MSEMGRAPLDPVELTEENLIGAVVYGQDDYLIGKIVHLHDLGYEVEVVIKYVDPLQAVIKPVALPASEMDFMRDNDGNVYATIERTRAEITAFPLHQD